MVAHVPRSFYSSCVLENRLCDFHWMNLTVMRIGYKIFQSRIVSYRSYNWFPHGNFRENLLYDFLKVNLVYYADDIQKVCDMGFEALNKCAPCKRKHA